MLKIVKYLNDVQSKRQTEVVFSALKSSHQQKGYVDTIGDILQG